ncbi:MAG: alanine racemase [Lachnospiraceae bacterium]|nr:alanine racemase [Lachnospiraceae bacterium]MDD3616905.1 alanine racemase [Lachnospiraceae bacterium]
MQKEQILSFLNTYTDPCYIFDLDELSRRFLMLQQTLGDEITLCYAMKANPFLVAPLLHLSTKYEVCSPGEFAICEKEHIPMDRIVLSGVNKEERELKRIMKTYGSACTYTVESLHQFYLLKSLAAQSNKTISVLLRLSSGNQFGMDEHTILELLKTWNNSDFLHFQGIQYYSGTQKKNLNRQEKELMHLDDFCRQVQQETQMIVEELEYGPGFYVPYFEKEEDADDIELLKGFKKILSNMNYSGKITLEMGRYIAAYCGSYLTKVIDTKVTHDAHYCIIDGGINHINYYGQAMAMKLPHIQYYPVSAEAIPDNQENKLKNEPEESKSPVTWNICGSLCTSGDVLVKQYPQSQLAIGDYLLFERLGAYSVTEGIYLFLSRDLPQIYFYTADNGFSLVRDSLPTHNINCCTAH